MASNYRTWGWSGSGYGERIYLEIWHSRTDVNTNKSTFSYKIYNNSYNSYGDTGDISWRISDQWNSSRVSGSLGNTPTTTYYQVKNYASGTFQITHSADGTMPNINFNLHISRSLGNTRSATVPLMLSNIPRIPRHSNATIPGSFTLGNAFTVKFNRASSSFWHWIDVKHGNTMLYSEKIYEDSVAITIDRNRVLDLTPNSNSVSLTIIYTTRTSNGTEIGRSTRSITCNLNAPSPTLGGITHNENVDIVKQIGIYVQSKSRLRVAITGASPGRGASIRTYRLEVDGQVLNASSGVTQPISKSGTLPIKATVIDSRGKSASKSVNISVLAYEPPKISYLRVFRATSSGAEDDYGTYIQMEVGYRITALNAKNSKSIKIVAGSHNKTVDLGSYERIHTELLSGFNVNNTYTYTIELHDLFGKTVTTAVIPTGAVTMMWGRDNLSIGTAKLKGSGTLNVRNQIYQNGNLQVADEHGQPIPDTRNDNLPPEWYFENRSKKVTHEFKYRSKIGLLGGKGTYVHLTTIVKWSDTSGGTISQLAIDDDGNEWKRVSTGNTTWGNWFEVHNDTNNVRNGQTIRHDVGTNIVTYSKTNGDGTCEIWGEFSSQKLTDSGNLHLPIPFPLKRLDTMNVMGLNVANRMVTGGYNGRNSSEVIISFFNTSTGKPAGSVSMFYYIKGAV